MGAQPRENATDPRTTRALENRRDMDSSPHCFNGSVSTFRSGKHDVFPGCRPEPMKLLRSCQPGARAGGPGPRLRSLAARALDPSQSRPVAEVLLDDVLVVAGKADRLRDRSEAVGHRVRRVLRARAVAGFALDAAERLQVR